MRIGDLEDVALNDLEDLAENPEPATGGAGRGSGDGRERALERERQAMTGHKAALSLFYMIPC